MWSQLCFFDHQILNSNVPNSYFSSFKAMRLWYDTIDVNVLKCYTITDCILPAPISEIWKKIVTFFVAFIVIKDRNQQGNTEFLGPVSFFALNTVSLRIQIKVTKYRFHKSWTLVWVIQDIFVNTICATCILHK